MEHTKPRRTKKQRVPNISFELSVNNKLFAVNASPVIIPSGDILYRVSYNDSPVHVFGWDEGLNRFAETDNQAEVIPPVIEMEIANKLNEVTAQMQRAA